MLHNAGTIGNIKSAEVELLGKIWHMSIVRLWYCCNSGDSQWTLISDDYDVDLLGVASVMGLPHDSIRHYGLPVDVISMLYIGSAQEVHGLSPLLITIITLDTPFIILGLVVLTTFIFARVHVIFPKYNPASLRNILLFPLSSIIIPKFVRVIGFSRRQYATIVLASDFISYQILIVATGVRALKLVDFGVSGSNAEIVCYLRDIAYANWLVGCGKFLFLTLLGSKFAMGLSIAIAVTVSILVAFHHHIHDHEAIDRTTTMADVFGTSFNFASMLESKVDKNDSQTIKMVSRLVITTMLSTYYISHRVRSFADKKKHPLLWTTTYHWHQPIYHSFLSVWPQPKTLKNVEGIFHDFKPALMRKAQPWDPGGHWNTSTADRPPQFNQWDPGKIVQESTYYNLEDKVALDGVGIVMSKPISNNAATTAEGLKRNNPAHEVE